MRDKKPNFFKFVSFKESKVTKISNNEDSSSDPNEESTIFKLAFNLDGSSPIIFILVKILSEAGNIPLMITLSKKPKELGFGLTTSVPLTSKV